MKIAESGFYPVSKYFYCLLEIDTKNNFVL